LNIDLHILKFINIPVWNKFRKKAVELAQEQWFQANKQQLKGLIVQEIVENLMSVNLAVFHVESSAGSLREASAFKFFYFYIKIMS